MTASEQPLEPETPLPSTESGFAASQSGIIETHENDQLRLRLELQDKLQVGRGSYLRSRTTFRGHSPASLSPLHPSGDNQLDELLLRAELLEAIIRNLQSDPILQKMLIDALTSSSQNDEITLSKTLIRRVGIVFTAVSFLGNLLSLILLLEGLIPGVMGWITSLIHVIFGSR